MNERFNFIPKTGPIPWVPREVDGKGP
jgi:hypothetical protein